ncbi:ribonuclease P [Malassezia brasiliensis]|uniref:Ribonuclease P n=1 Tax=Malassezia brasiliensis TaxID=1821822 RepID=A0AAF0DQY8_9BASI|nr:ribonuclease P [Malassezia brasiliensis]
MVHGKFDPSTQINPFRRQQQLPQPPFPKLDPRVCGKALDQATPLTQLSRLTVVLDKDNLVKSGTGFVTANSNALLQYDLLSVMPLTDTAFQHACITLSELKPFSIDIITLDLAASPRLPFHLKRSTVGAALANGVVFEITYGDALDPSRETRDVSTARRNLFSNARDLLRVTNGKETRQTFRGAVSRLSVESVDMNSDSKSSSGPTSAPEMVRAKEKTKPRKRKRNEQGI